MKGTRIWLSALLGGATLIALSCGDPGAPTLRSDLFGPLPPAGLLRCSPLPADSVTQTIGPAGGTLQVGPHSLSVPPGALDSAVAITAVAPSDTVNRVQFQPEGLTFLQSPSLTMSYANCDLFGSTLSKEIVYASAALNILQYLPSVDDLTAQKVTAQLQHFSDYAIAW